MIVGLSILLLAVGNVALAGMLALLSRRYRNLDAEVVELQAVADMLLLADGKPALFAARHGLEYVLDPTKLPPPEVHP